MLAEGKTFLDFKNFRHKGMSLWLGASAYAKQSAPSILRRLQMEGCSITERDSRGFNCLFMSVLYSRTPYASHDLERLEYLLGVFGDICARDAKGRTLFDFVDSFQEDGSYMYDLWYCALQRVGIDVSSHIAQHPRIPRYGHIANNHDDSYRDDYIYTPEHYHALKHLQSWDVSNFRSQMDRLLQEIPLNEEEAREMERLPEMEIATSDDGETGIDDEYPSDEDHEGDEDDDSA
jgi:hypothetical protein